MSPTSDGDQPSVIARLPERVRTPAVARAVVSPSALLLAGAGTAAAILGGIPLVAAAAVGVACWAGRVAMAVPRRKRAERIEPRKLMEPWRGFVLEAQAARRRFDTTCARTAPGPLRDRLTSLGQRIGDGVTECWQIAVHGDALQRAFTELDVAAIHKELASVRDEPAGASRDRTEKALESQLASAQRIAKVADDARDRLRVLNAQMDEATARAVELSVKTGDVSELSPLSDDVESTVSELESLRQALDETSGTPDAGPTAAT